MKTVKYISTAAAVAAAMMSSEASAVAGSASSGILSWVNPTQATDGSLLSNSITAARVTCSGIVISGVRSACSLTPVLLSGTPTTYTVNYTFTNPVGGQICWTVAVQIDNGQWSGESNEACKTEAPAPKIPSTPSSLTVR